MRWSSRVVLCVAVAALALPAGSWAASSGAQPGTYRGKTQTHYDLSFTISPGARTIKRFRSAVVAYCVSGIAPDGPTVKSVTMPTIEVSRGGRFDRTFTTKVEGATVAIRVRGTISGRRVTGGKIAYDLTGDGIECKTDGPQPFTAKRTS